MHVIEVDSVHDAYVKGMTLIKEQGWTQPVRENVNTLNIHNAAFVLSPKFNERHKFGYFDRLVYCKNRKLTAKTQLAEFCWYMTGSNSVAIIEPFIKGWSKFSDDGETVNSNYGHIWKYQVQHTIKKLLIDKHTRQAVIQIYDKSMTSNYISKDINCTMSVVFNINRDDNGDRLDMTVNMRSNDIVYGTPIDMFCFSMLHELIANELRDYRYSKLRLGTYTHIAQSLHLYDSKFDLMDAGHPINEEKLAKFEGRSIDECCTFNSFFASPDSYLDDMLKDYFAVFGKYTRPSAEIYKCLVNITLNTMLDKGMVPSCDYEAEDIMTIINLIKHEQPDVLNSLVDFVLKLSDEELFEHVYQCVKYANKSIETTALIGLILSNETKPVIDSITELVNVTAKLPVLHTDIIDILECYVNKAEHS